MKAKFGRYFNQASIALLLGVLPAYSAYGLDYCADLGGLTELVDKSYKDYSQSQFSQANSNIHSDLKIILDELDVLEGIPSEPSDRMQEALSNLQMSLCQEDDLLYVYPVASGKVDRPPVGILWRVGDIVLPGDESTKNNPVDPLFFQAPHFREAEPVAVRLMRETRAKVMVIALNRHNREEYPNSMNAARPGSHIFLDVSNDVMEKYPQMASIVLHGMRRRDNGNDSVSGMIQPGDNSDTMNARKLFNVPSFNDMLAKGMGEALEQIPDSDPKLKTELRAPNGSQFGIGDLNKFFWAVNTSHVNGFSTEHIKRIQAVHYEMPQTMRYQSIGGYLEPNPYFEGSQQALVLGINLAMEEYKEDDAFLPAAQRKYCNSDCRQAYFRAQGISLYSKRGLKESDEEVVVPVNQDDRAEYDVSFITEVGSLKFPGVWKGALTLHQYTDGTGYSRRYNGTDSNTEGHVVNQGVGLAVVEPIPNAPAETIFIEAEAFDEKHGDVREVNDGGWIGYIDSGDWVKYSNVNFTGGVGHFTANIASKTDTSSGTIEVYLDSLDGDPVTVLTDTPVEGGWKDFELATVTLEKPIFGLHDVYLKFRYGYNVESFSFTPVQSVSIEAENYNDKKGDVRKASAGDWLGYIDTGNWVKYNDVAFGNGANKFTAEIASKTDTSYGAISVHLGSVDNPAVGVLSGVPVEGGWQDFSEASITLNKTVYGVHDVFLKFESGYNVDSLRFTLE
ncbi:carbohydrate-binding protein [Marinibactrum halimedae]|nr:carbohydrate-binding protein [Marinibactrum halimedae]MCD9460135.1 carbohydrate-binding protein [Marinibactrum halimedae]